MAVSDLTNVVKVDDLEPDRALGIKVAFDLAIWYVFLPVWHHDAARHEPQELGVRVNILHHPEEVVRINIK